MHLRLCIMDICGMMYNHLLRVASNKTLQRRMRSCEGMCALCSHHRCHIRASQWQ